MPTLVYFGKFHIGNLPFTTESLLSFLERAKSEENVFFALEIWRRAGYIGTSSYLISCIVLQYCNIC